MSVTLVHTAHNTFEFTYIYTITIWRHAGNFATYGARPSCLYICTTALWPNVGNSGTYCAVYHPQRSAMTKQQERAQKNEDNHPFNEWDSNTVIHCLSDRTQWCIQYTASCLLMSDHINAPTALTPSEEWQYALDRGACFRRLVWILWRREKHRPAGNWNSVTCPRA
jgi:hypothetical protein